MTQLATLPARKLERSLGLIEQKVQSVSQYVEKWLQFQALWDLEADYVYQVTLPADKSDRTDARLSVSANL